MLLKLDLQRFAPVPEVHSETWVLNDVINSTLATTAVNFTFNDIEYFGIRCADEISIEISFFTNRALSLSHTVYSDGWFKLQRTIIFEEAPTGDLLTWLQTNGVKQQPTYKFKHWKKSNVVVNRTLVGQKYYYFKPYTILGLYKITTTLTNCTGASANATKIQENGGLTLTFTANSGYELPTGVSVTNVTSYNWNKATGVLAISKPTGDVTIEIVAVSALPQLSTPTNVSVTDTTLSFDEVENATSYEVFVDNVSIGTHTNVIEYQITVTNSNTNYKDVENLLIYESDTNSLSTSGATKLGEVSSNQTVVFNVTKKYILVNNIYGYVKSYSGGLTLVNSEYGTTLFEVSNNGTITATGYYCLTGDTLITLANGTQKRIDELTLQDKVLSYNPTTQELETDEITYVDSMENKTYTEYDIWTFSNGAIIKTVHRHRFYNVERQEMTYMDKWNIGEHAINQNGELITLVSHENVKEKVKHYTIFTKNQNYYANGLLSGNRYTKSLHLVGNSNPIERGNKGGQ